MSTNVPALFTEKRGNFVCTYCGKNHARVYVHMYMYSMYSEHVYTHTHNYRANQSPGSGCGSPSGSPMVQCLSHVMFTHFTYKKLQGGKHWSGGISWCPLPSVYKGGVEGPAGSAIAVPLFLAMRNAGALFVA